MAGTVKTAKQLEDREVDDERRAGRPGYLAKLAHELKTPLTAIVAASEVMREESFGPLGDERYKAYASDIHDSARHVLDVINRMLEHRTAEPAGAQLVPVQVDVNALVESCVSSLAPVAKREGLELRTTLAERLPHVIADAMSLKQILLNLLTNAIKYNLDGGSIHVATRFSADSPLTITVEDTGRGMSSEQVELILHGGSSANVSTTDGEFPGRTDDQNTESCLSGGLGLGLPMVRALAQANGAKLALSSNEGQGTIVSVVFANDRVIPI